MASKYTRPEDETYMFPLPDYKEVNVFQQERSEYIYEQVRRFETGEISMYELRTNLSGVLTEAELQDYMASLEA